jgi:hypothetical protein
MVLHASEDVGEALEGVDAARLARGDKRGLRGVLRFETAPSQLRRSTARKALVEQQLQALFDSSITLSESGDYENPLKRIM